MICFANIAPPAAAKYEPCTLECTGLSTEVWTTCVVGHTSARTSNVFRNTLPSARRSRWERPAGRALKKDRSVDALRLQRDLTAWKPSASSHETIRVVISEAPS